MNKIRAIQALNKKEIEQGISPDASWHADYRDTAFVYFGGLPYELSEGDVITIFSQFGEPVFLKLARDNETGKSKGFGWLKYENQRSTDLAVDNLGGAEIGGRMISVDHARYKPRDDEDPDEFKIGWEDMMRREGKAVSEDESSDEETQRPLLPEEQELATLMREHDDDDPMKGFLIEEKKKEVDEAKRRADRKDRKHKHRRHRSHRHKIGDDSDDGHRRSRSRGDESKDSRDRRQKGRDSVQKRDRGDSPQRDRRRGRREEDAGSGRRRDRHRDSSRDMDRGRGRHDRQGSGEPDRRKRRDDGGHERRHTWRSRSRSPRRREDKI
ncbi:RNA-binding protein Cwf29 [Purpureocillium takamizusanense]|uniref:RNA-binding protein Cwf29 n=1 Tax=Purpureocillium takamizusanense TaxID=2060973 RepID=A0A9Q8Q4X7_9HYPO|nr:RNA-binding protein Cwf29 [Purpureocillium takamizusanense]UNI13764.1 RNA-binding protein Cwf29 [Purpureocillium takamizusanense]